MKNSAILTALVVGLCASLSSFAQAPASAPAGTTGLCKDGSFTTSASKKGTCQGHKGVKTWYGTAAASTANATPAATAGNKVASAAAGGGPGQVWVNTRTKVYHCAGDKAYGKTKQGQYLTEAAAKAAGDHPAHGKTCS
ncbi:DUF3761 domain-containing protein [Burkholderia ubonensis]|uniref:DUF3761 domain-containing protein n=1 Tax=Burkholderia ubonensis TaxID=101571 RepID=UPI00075757FE|nr:DUF3761 domain-containing protein [Burkholderia ubonensis]KVW72266.1 hypothetical protein WK99_00080 [Burkholderia ubonensis]KWN79861.1 hypothetical protein WM24_25305 [Burkholderia ubonensis]